MSEDAGSMDDVYAKLDWAAARHVEMQRIFREFAKPGGGDDRPYGIEFHQPGKPAGLVLARFIIESSMPSEMSLLAGDLVHNTRTALDYVLARLKARFGGDVGRGSFPTWQSEDLWQANVARKGARSALNGLDPGAAELIYTFQPLHRETPAEDSLVILNQLDNADKHRLLHPSFVYTAAGCGLDLIEIRDQHVVGATNLWTAGEPLENRTKLARFMIHGDAKDAIGARTDAEMGFASGPLGAPRTEYTAMIDRVREVADAAAALMGDGSAEPVSPPARG